MAVDIDRAFPLAVKQLQEYDQILKAVTLLSDNDASALESLKNLITKYFSVHLLLHNTYEQVFIKCRDLLIQADVPSAVINNLMTLILTPPLIDWEASQKIQTKKDLLAVSRRIKEFPALGPLEEKRHHEAAALDCLAQSLEVQDLPEETIRYCSYAACVGVTKEWKFAMNKILFSAFGEIAHSVASTLALSTAEIRLISIDSLVELARKRVA
jgi:hypothetical protein